VWRLDCSTVKWSGRMPVHFNSAERTAAVTTTNAIPSVRVAKERSASFRRPATIPTQVAQIGSRSGLTAIAPTIRIELEMITPIAAITAATLISTT
jgi:hypothetical protein